METDYVKTASIAAWILAVGTLGYVSGATSFAAWTVLAVLSLAPAAVMTRLLVCGRSEHVREHSGSASVINLIPARPPDVLRPQPAAIAGNLPRHH
jgi:hypothetical protein